MACPPAGTLVVTGDPHRGARVLSWGTPLADAASAAVFVHGRGASAADILGLAGALAPTEGMAVLAPDAAGGTWYPYRFIEPIERNEPWLSSALRLLRSLVDEIGRAGIPLERTAVLGFSQGACLALEFVARNAGRYGAVAGLSGGLLGPPGTPRDYPGHLAGTPVFLGCSDVDFHIPAERVRETAEVVARMGAAVDMRLYPGMGHTINQDEADAVSALLSGLVRA